MRHWMTGILSLLFFWIDTLILRYLSWSNPLLCPFHLLLLPLLPPSPIFSSHAVIVHGTPPSSLPIQTLLASSSLTTPSSTVVSFFLPFVLPYSWTTVSSQGTPQDGIVHGAYLLPSLHWCSHTRLIIWIRLVSFHAPPLPLQPVRLPFKQQERFAFFPMRVPDYFSISDCCQSCLPPYRNSSIEWKVWGPWGGGGEGDLRVSRESSTHFSHHSNLWTTLLKIGCRQLEWPKEDTKMREKGRQSRFNLGLFFLPLSVGARCFSLFE